MSPIRVLSFLLGGGLAVAGIYLYTASKGRTTWGPNSIDNPLIMSNAPRHPVTPEMWEDAAKSKGVLAPKFEGKTLEGENWSLDKLNAGPNGPRPVLVYFIKADCPCSADADPLLRSLYQHFKKRVPFIGIINTYEKTTRQWMTTHKDPYPVIMDPDLKAMKAYRATRSVYTALIGKDQRIIRLWPGYSVKMLTELNELIAQELGEKPVKFDVAYAPEEINSGCLFEGSEPGYPATNVK